MPESAPRRTGRPPPGPSPPLWKPPNRVAAHNIDLLLRHLPGPAPALAGRRRGHGRQRRGRRLPRSSRPGHRLRHRREPGDPVHRGRPPDSTAHGERRRGAGAGAGRRGAGGRSTSQRGALSGNRPGGRGRRLLPVHDAVLEVDEDRPAGGQREGRRGVAGAVGRGAAESAGLRPSMSTDSTGRPTAPMRSSALPSTPAFSFLAS
ncbi:hypothetical protein ACRAWF_11975 [Streptomyces sp. L7]